MTTWPSASTPWTWNTDLAMSRPIVVIACMLGSSNCGGLNSTHIHGTHVPVEEPSTASITDSCTAANSISIRSPHRRRWGPSRRLQIGLPGRERDIGGRVRVFAPQFAAVKTHGVEPVRILAAAGGVAVGEYVAAVHARDDTDMSAHVSRQTRVSLRMHVPRANTVAGFEPCRACRRPIVR